MEEWYIFYPVLSQSFINLFNVFKAQRIGFTLLLMIFEKNEKHKYLLHHAKQFEKRAKENFDHNNLSKIYLLYNIETTTLAQKGSFYWIFK